MKRRFLIGMILGTVLAGVAAMVNAEDTTEAATEAVTEEMTETQEDMVIVTINGEDIYQSELDSLISSLSSRMESYGIDVSDELVAETIRTSAMDELVDDRILTQDMTAKGCYDLTEEEQNSIAETASEYYNAVYEEYKAYFQEYVDDTEGTEDSGLDSDSLAAAYLSQSGMTIAYLENYYTNALASQRYEEMLMEGEADITDEEVEAAYEAKVAESKELYGEDVSTFETALQNDEEVWYRPAGYRSILQIMLATEGETDEERLASVKEKTDEIYEKLEAGESFEDLISEYGEDTNFNTEGFFQTGYQVHQESVVWEQAFIDAAYGEDMQEYGDYTKTPVIFGETAHILYYMKDIEEGAVDLTDDLREALRSDLYNDKADQKLEKYLAQLKEASEIVYASES